MDVKEYGWMWRHVDGYEWIWVDKDIEEYVWIWMHMDACGCMCMVIGVYGWIKVNISGCE